MVGESAISGLYTGEIYGCLRLLQKIRAPKTKRLSEKVVEIGLRGYFWTKEKARSKSLSVRNEVQKTHLDLSLKNSQTISAISIS